jgi:hypothetical protein
MIAYTYEAFCTCEWNLRVNPLTRFWNVTTFNYLKQLITNLKLLQFMQGPMII